MASAAFAFLCLHVAKAQTVAVTEINIDNHSGDTYEITTAGTYKITGNNTPNNPTSKNIKVNVESGEVNITIENINISTNGSNGSPFDITKGKVNLTLSGNNALIATGNWKAGLRVAEGATLTIKGDNSASLNSTGDARATGIGGNQNESMGTVHIEGGTITAKEGAFAAGIGIGPSKGSGSGAINISGGYVEAHGGGGSNQGALGCSGGANGSVSITISGGVVYARGGSYGYEGTGDINTKGTVTISNALVDFDTNKSYTISNSIEFNDKNGTNKNQGKVHGSYTLKQDYEIPEGKTLTLDNGASITVNSGATLTNSGAITNNGTITNNGAIRLAGTITGNGITGEELLYAITYKSNYVGGAKDIIGYIKASTTLPTDVFTHEYHTFDGWYDAATSGSPVTTISGITTLYARWKPVDFTAKSSITVETTYGTAYEHTFTASELSDDITSNAGGLKEMALKGGSTLPNGLSLSGLKISGTPSVVNESGTSVTFTVTATNDATAEVTITFKVKKATLTVTPAANQSIYTEEADTYEPSFTSAGAIGNEEAAFSGKLGWDSGTKVFTLGTLALADNGDFKAGNYSLVLASNPGTIEIKEEDIPVEISGTPTGGNDWYTDDITLTAPTGFTIKGNGKVRATNEWQASITVSEEGNYSYSYSLLRNGQETPVDKALAVKLDKTPPTLSATSDKLSYTLSFGDGAEGSGIAQLLVDDQDVTPTPGATTYSGTSTAGQHKAKVIDNTGHATAIEFTLEDNTPPYIPPVDPEPTPIYYTVTLPTVEGAVTDPIAGEYPVESWSSFRFYLTLDAAYDTSVPVVTTSHGETITPRESDGAYIIKYIRQPVEILINGIVKNPDPVGNETIASAHTKIWSANGNLHIRAAINGKLYIYSATGSLHTVRKINVGDELTIPLPAGIYLVRLGEEGFKVVL